MRRGNRIGNFSQLLLRYSRLLCRLVTVPNKPSHAPRNSQTSKDEKRDPPTNRSLQRNNNQRSQCPAQSAGAPDPTLCLRARPGREPPCQRRRDIRIGAHHKTIRVRIRRGPSLSPSAPVGISNTPYERTNAPRIQPQRLVSICKSPCMRAAATEMLIRSRKVMTASTTRKERTCWRFFIKLFVSSENLTRPTNCERSQER